MRTDDMIEEMSDLGQVIVKRLKGKGRKYVCEFHHSFDDEGWCNVIFDIAKTLRLAVKGAYQEAVKDGIIKS